MAKTRIFKVTVHYGRYKDTYHISAVDDEKARRSAVLRWLHDQNDKPADGNMTEKDVDYCEIELLAETD